MVNHRSRSFVKGFLRSADERETPGSKQTLGLGSCFPYAATPQASSPTVASLCYQLASDQTSQATRIEFLDVMELPGLKAHISLLSDFKCLESELFGVIVVIANG